MIADPHRARNYHRWITNHIPRGVQVCEVGGGAGTLTQWLWQRDCDITVWEQSNTCVAMLTHMIDHCGRGDQVRVIPQKFVGEGDQPWLVQEVMGENIWSEGLHQWLPLPPRFPHRLPNRWLTEVWSAPCTHTHRQVMWMRERSEGVSHQSESLWHTEPPHTRSWCDQTPADETWRQELERLWQINQPVLQRATMTLPTVMTVTEPTEWRLESQVEYDLEQRRFRDHTSEWQSDLVHPEWLCVIDTPEPRVWVLIQTLGQHDPHTGLTDWWDHRAPGDRLWIDLAREGHTLNTWGQGQAKWFTDGSDHITVSHRWPSHPQPTPAWSVVAQQGEDRHDLAWFYLERPYQ